MIKWGAVVDASDHDALVDYLSTNFSVEQAPYQAPRTSANRRFRRSRTRQEEFRRTPGREFQRRQSATDPASRKGSRTLRQRCPIQSPNLCQSMRRRMH